MIVSIGRIFLLISVPVSLIGLLISFFFSRRKPFLGFLLSLYTFLSLLFLLLTSFCSLIYAYIISDFSLVSVVMNSDMNSQVFYKVAGVLGSHEGSMLLWVILLLCYGSSFSLNLLSRKRNLEKFNMSVVVILGLSSFMIFFIAVESNPFTRVLYQQPNQGIGLNPALHDPILAVHPPILYLGMSCLSIPFALVLTKVYDLGLIRFWIILSWSFMTAGIGLGSYWAYHELGWGGWWFWDPVESISLIPWLLSTAALHSLSITIRRNGIYLLKTTSVLTMTSFLSCLLELFLVRSGTLLSVHSFANAPRRGVWLLILLLVFLVFSLISFSRIKLSFLSPSPNFSLILSPSSFHSSNLNTRRFHSFNTKHEYVERIVIVGLCIFSVLAFTIILGLVYPFLFKKISGFLVVISSQYYLSTFIPIALIGIFFMLVVLIPSWFFEETKTKRNQGFLILGLVATTTFCCSTWIYIQSKPVENKLLFVSLLIIDLSVIVGVLLSLVKDFKLKLKILPMVLSHGGLGLAVMGMILSSFLAKESSFSFEKNVPGKFEDMDITLLKIDQFESGSYFSQVATIKVKNRKEEFFLYPERRFYPKHEVIKTKIGLYKLGVSDLYVVLSEYQVPSKWLVRVSYYPGINLIWFGTMMTAVSGFLACLRQRKINLMIVDKVSL